MKLNDANRIANIKPVPAMLNTAGDSAHQLSLQEYIGSWCLLALGSHLQHPL